MEPTNMFNNFNSDFISVDVPEIILQIVKAETHSQGNEPEDSSDDEHESRETADNNDKDDGHKETTAKNLKALSSIDHKCNLDENSNPNRQSNLGVSKGVKYRDPGLQDLYSNNVQSKIRHDHQAIHSPQVPLSQYKYDVYPPKTFTEQGNAFKYNHEEFNQPSYTVTVDDVRRVLETMTTKDNMIRNKSSEGPTLENVQYKDVDNIDNNVAITGHIEQNLNGNIEIKMSKANNQETNDNMIKFLRREKQLYNIKTILECTNATIIKPRGEVSCMCYVCDNFFQNPSDLKEHSINTHMTIQYSIFKNMRFGRDIAKFDVTNLYCKLCNETLVSLQVTISHLNRVHKKKLFTDIKNYIFPFKFVKGSLVCCVCSMTFRHFRTLFKHLQVHLRYFECDKCNSAFATWLKLRSHKRLIHKENSYNCQFCSATFYTNLKLKMHLNTVHEQLDKYKCGFCNNSFKDMALMQLHLTRVHNVRHESVRDEVSVTSVETANLSTVTFHNSPANDLLGLQIVAPSTSSIELTNKDNEEFQIIKTFLNNHTMKETIQLRENENKHVQPRDSFKKGTEYIDLTDDFQDLTNGCNEFTNSKVPYRDISADPVNEFVDDIAKSVDLAHKCEICDKALNTAAELIVHLKQCVVSGRYNSGEDIDEEVELIIDISNECNINGEINLNEHRNKNNFNSLSGMYNILNEDMQISNLQIVLECTNATLIVRDNFGYKCLFCNDHFQNALDLKNHTIHHIGVSNYGIYHADMLASICSNLIPKLDITDLYCKLCGKQIDTLCNLIIHLKSVHKKKIYNIENRIEVVRFNRDLKIKNGKSNNNNINGGSNYSYKCSYCDEIFGNLRFKELHVLKIHNVEAADNCNIATVDSEGKQSKYNGPINVCDKYTNNDNERKRNALAPRNTLYIHNKEYMNIPYKGPTEYSFDLEMVLAKEWKDDVLKKQTGRHVIDNDHRINDLNDDDVDMTIVLEAPPSLRLDDCLNPLRSINYEEDSQPLALDPVVFKQVNPLEHPTIHLRTMPSMSFVDIRDPAVEDAHMTSLSSAVVGVREHLDSVTHKNVWNDEVTERNQITKYAIKNTGQLKAKHLHNAPTILNCTNATLVRSEDETRYKCRCCTDSFLNPSD